MIQTISAVVLLLVLVTGIVHLADLDDRVWYLWHNQQVAKDVKHKAIWLPDYRADVTEHLIPGIDYNASGITFNHDRNTLWVIVNQPTLLIELDLDFNHLRSISLENFQDTEAVAYVGEDVFAICDERAHSLVLGKVREDTRQLDKNTLKQLSISLNGYNNRGLEGIAVDPATRSIYTVRECDPMKLMKVSGFIDQQNAIHIEAPGHIQVTNLFMEDLSGLHFHGESNHLLILSDESKLLAEIDLQGKRVSYMDLEKGFSNLKRSIPQAEGVTMDHQGYLYIVSEPNLIYRFGKSGH